MADSQFDAQERYAHMRRENEELRALLGDVRRTLAKRLQTVANVAEMLNSLMEKVETHFSEEEAEGFIAEVEQQEPRLTQYAEALKDEHVRLRQTISGLVELTKDQNDSDDWWQRLQDGFQRFSTDWMHRESKENELLQQAHTQDIGSQDQIP